MERNKGKNIYDVVLETHNIDVNVNLDFDFSFDFEVNFWRHIKKYSTKSIIEKTILYEELYIETLRIQDFVKLTMGNFDEPVLKIFTS